MGNRGALLVGNLTHLLPAAQGSSLYPSWGICLPFCYHVDPTTHSITVSPETSPPRAFVGVCVSHTVRYMAGASDVWRLWRPVGPMTAQEPKALASSP